MVEWESFCGVNKLRHQQISTRDVWNVLLRFHLSSNRLKETWDILQLCVISNVYCCICVSLFRCVGQHGKVQRSGSVQLQHADSVRPRKDSVCRSTRSIVRPGPQRHQQTVTDTGNTLENEHTVTINGLFPPVRVIQIYKSSVWTQRDFKKINYSIYTTLQTPTHSEWLLAKWKKLNDNT